MAEAGATPAQEIAFTVANANAYMTFGKVPGPQIVAAFQTSLILYAEHSFNACTFTARVVTSTLSDIYSAVTASIGALKGPLHGGANEAVMHMMEEITIPDNAKPWLDDALADHADGITEAGLSLNVLGRYRPPPGTWHLTLNILEYPRPGHLPKAQLAPGARR